MIAAGGLYDGRSMLAAMVLGAEGVQIGKTTGGVLWLCTYIVFYISIYIYIYMLCICCL